MGRRSFSSMPRAIRGFLNAAATACASGWETTSPTPEFTTTASTSSALTETLRGWHAKARSRRRGRSRTITRWRSGRAGQCRRRAGPAHRTAAVISIPSTARIRFLWIPSVRCGRSPSPKLGHVLYEESDRRVSLLERLVQHAEATARYAVYYGEGRDAFDVRGRVAHETIFNPKDGSYRCPATQQGYSPFSTWTRGLAWAILGFAEELEFTHTLPAEAFTVVDGADRIEAMMLRAAEATADFYIEQTPTDGVPYWDTGAPGLARLGDYLLRPSDPFNDFEPVDSSAAAIAAQGLWRLGNYLVRTQHRAEDGRRYRQAALTVARTLFAEPYLSTDPAHQGLILHSVYHRPRGWDYIPEGRRVPCGESSMWGDFHAREMALILLREARHETDLCFFNM